MKPDQPSTHGAMALGSSPMLTAWMALASAGGCALILVYLPLLPAVVLSAALLWQAWRATALHALRTARHAVVAVRLAGTTLELKLRSGEWLAGDALPGTVVTAMLTVLRWRSSEAPSQTGTVVVCPDAMDADEYRRLRRYLRWR